MNCKSGRNDACFSGNAETQKVKIDFASLRLDLFTSCFPYGEKQSRYDESGYSRDVAYDSWQAETILGNEQERKADRRHEHGRKKRNPIIFLLPYQVNGYCPKREYR